MTSWVVPSGPLPRVRGLRVAVDTETKDGGLDRGRGPGWVYDDGYLLGVSMAWAGTAIYVPVRHPDTENRPVGEVVSWVEDIFRENDVVMFNAGYDMGWLRQAGVRCWPRRLDDPGMKAKLIDETHLTYGLDALCGRHGILGKDETLLDQAFHAYGAMKKNGSYKHAIWMLPARYVGEYAEQDAVSTLQLDERVQPLLEAQRLEHAYDTERRLIPCIYDMRRTGIPIDTDRGEAAQVLIRGQRDEVLAGMRAPSGRVCTIEDVRSPGTLAKMFRAEGLDYPMTAPTKPHPEGLPSFTKLWLEAHPHPLAAQVRRARQLEDLAEKFIGNYILSFEHRGRIHAEIHQLKSDSGGTGTTRFSYSSPPLQQMPARAAPGDKAGHAVVEMIRSIFEADRGKLWFAPDYSQQELRLAVHLAASAKIHGAEDAVRYYEEKGDEADFHTMVAEMASINRSSAKTINFGLMFGMGEEKLARSLGLSDEDAQELLTLYHSRVPWVRGLSQECEKLAQSRGFIRMLDGARRHFPMFEKRWNKDSGGWVRGLDAAKMKWPGEQIQRAKCRDGMNSAVQGSAARQMKIAMVRCYESGHTPVIQMHDELGFSLDNPRHGEEIVTHMIEAIPLLVPVKVDAEWGTNWGNAKFKSYEAARRSV
jgi:DNA polymerase-1